MSNDYKNSLNFGETEFPMRANAAANEPKRLDNWQQDNLYGNLQAVSEQRNNSFVLHDGPPYANGQLHIGHAVNKILKDAVVRSKSMQGYRAPYIPGWDCHGLPIEQQVEKLGIDKSDPSKFRAHCRQFAQEQIAIQREGFERMGVLGEWEDHYQTMKYQTEAGTLKIFATLFANKALQRKLRPVLWCSSCRSALAEAEIEYDDEYVSEAIYVPFAFCESVEVLRAFGLDLGASVTVTDSKVSGDIDAVIWTTTTWTLPANKAICVHPKIKYNLVKLSRLKADGSAWQIVVAESLLEKIYADLDCSGEVLAVCLGERLEGLFCRHPYLPETVPLLAAEHVTEIAGTGLVHTAPGHGQDDFLVGQQHGLEVSCPVDSKGVFFHNTPEVGLMSLAQANAHLWQLLSQKDRLLAKHKYKHSYPLCWRHRTPVVFRSTKQWFLAMDEKLDNLQSNTLRKVALEQISNTKFFPGWGKERLYQMIANRPDWCLSRQRYWNTPIAMLLHKQTGEPHPQTDKIFAQAIAALEQEGIEGWHNLAIEDLVEDHAEYEKSTDGLDVWFDSGATHTTVLGWNGDEQNRPDMYLEGSDQHRGWFHSSLLIGCALYAKAPYREILTHGFVVDEQGYKMSKSKGNVVSPAKVIGTYGADILRLWVLSTDYSAEMRVSNNIIQQTVDKYRRLRNTIRFLLQNLSDMKVEDLIDSSQLRDIDRHSLEVADRLQHQLAQYYDNYEFYKVVNVLYQYCNIELGGFYLDGLKDTLYVCPQKSTARRSAQTALWHILQMLLEQLAPILVYTVDEAWNIWRGKDARPIAQSVWQNIAKPAPNQKFTENWQLLMSLFDQVRKQLEFMRNAKKIGSSLEAKVEISFGADQQAALYQSAANSLESDLRYLFMVSQVQLVQDKSQVEPVIIKVSQMDGDKCVRCWHFDEQVGDDSTHPQLCPRCVLAITTGKVENRLHA